MKIIPLSEGSFTIDKTKLFVPFDTDTDNLQERPVGSLLVEIQPFVIVTDKDVVLLDTGLGFEQGGAMQLHQNLQAAGLDAGSITKVLMSHLHKDHAGGLGDANGQLSLPNADYYVHREEFEFAMEKGLPSYIPAELEVLKNNPRVNWLEGDCGWIDDYIEYRQTGAHSPKHQVFWIYEGGETVFFGGDDAPQLQQMKVRYKTKYDFNPDLAMNLRRQWWEEGNQKGWTFLFYHDINTPTYQKP